MHSKHGEKDVHVLVKADQCGKHWREGDGCRMPVQESWVRLLLTEMHNPFENLGGRQCRSVVDHHPACSHSPFVLLSQCAQAGGPAVVVSVPRNRLFFGKSYLLPCHIDRCLLEWCSKQGLLFSSSHDLKWRFSFSHEARTTELKCSSLCPFC